MSDRYFVDTNVLVYAHDRGSGEKHEAASALVAKLWEDRSGVLSTQVIQEFYVNVRQRAARPLSRPEAHRLIEDYLSWEIVVNDGSSVLQALEMEGRYKISFWDALIVQAASGAGTSLLYSEDLNHGQSYGSVVVWNPFLN
jgi:predicted nucleic acid-binding protein